MIVAIMYYIVKLMTVILALCFMLAAMFATAEGGPVLPYLEAQSYQQAGERAKIQRRCPTFQPLDCELTIRCGDDEDCIGPNQICCPGNCGAGICVYSTVAAATAEMEAAVKNRNKAFAQGNTPDVCGSDYDVPSCGTGLQCANSGHCYNGRCCLADCGLGMCTPYPTVKMQVNTPDVCGPNYDVPSCGTSLQCANSGHCYNGRCCLADCGLGMCTPYPYIPP